MTRPASTLPAPGRCVVIGVLNVTPDSFSDGRRYANLDAAVRHGQLMAEQGADLVDVGGESTRPGAVRVDSDEECRRVLPVVRELAGAGVAVSIDTTRAAVAERALAAGAVVVNDVSGGLADPTMVKVVAAAGVPWVLMHWRGHSREMAQLATYDDVVADVVDELSARIDDAVSGGVAADALVIDPGLGFAKRIEHDLALLAHLDRLVAIGPPVLVGASRKSFLGRVLADTGGNPRPVEEREDATAAITALAAAVGVWGVRVHDVPANVDVARVVAAVVSARGASQ